MLILFLLYLFNLSFLKHISEEGLAKLKFFEGFESTSYSDIASVSTIGYGTTSDVQKITGIKIYKGLKVTKEVAEEWLIKTLKYKYERLVNKYDKYYTFNQNQFDALVSFTYNMGEKNLNNLLQNGTRSKELISSKILEYYNFYNTTSKKYQKSDGLVKRRQQEKELFDKEPQNSGIVHKTTDLIGYNLDLGTIIAYLLKENQESQSQKEEEDMNIIYYDEKGNNYRTKCKYDYSYPSYVIKCINTESIQVKGNIYIKLDKNKKISNGDIISSFDSKNFNEKQFAEFRIIDSFANLQITYFYNLYYLYYSVYEYGTYFSYIFRLSTKLKDEDFPENFPIRIYMYFANSPVKTEELNCHSNKLSILEDDYDYEYIISCSAFSSGTIYEIRNGNYFIQFRSFYQPVSSTAYNPLIMSANPKKVNITNPYSVIKIQKYETSYQIIKNVDELKNLEITFKGIYIINEPKNVHNDYYDYGIYFITNNKEKLNTKCLINVLENNEIKLICKINVENLENFMELKDGIYNSYIFISNLDIDYVFNYGKSDIIILERFIIDIGGSILISRINDKTTIDDLKKDFRINNLEDDNKEKENNNNNKDNNSDQTNNQEQDNNIGNNNIDKQDSSKRSNTNNEGQNIIKSNFIIILIGLFIYL